MAKKSVSKKQVTLSGRVFDEVILTLEECKAYADKWKDRLGLRDWIVILKLVGSKDIPMESAQACVQGREDKQIIEMWLLNGDEYGPGLLPQNMKKSILHELMHVVLYPLNIKKKFSAEEERVVDRVALAIYNLESGNC